MKKPTCLLVSPFGDVCGISEYAAYWKQAVEAQGWNVEVETNLHPQGVLERKKLPPMVVLNYQAALLSQWHSEHIKDVQARDTRVLTIWHDSGVPNSDHCRSVCEVSNAFVLHEP